MSTERDKPVVELLTIDPVDAHNFRVGMPVVLDRYGRRMTGLRLLLWRARDRVHRMTRWWRPRLVCSAIDVAEGRITMTEERWSWRRWRWERVA